MKNLILSAVLGALVLTPAALAETHEVRMLSMGSDRQPMVFEPAYLEIAPGDTVTFVNAMGAHNAQSVPGMLPDGAESFEGRMAQDVSFTPTVEGVYGIKCLPHYGAGMVALIKVGEGDASNLAAASEVRHPGRARDRFAALIEQVSAE